MKFIQKLVSVVDPNFIRGIIIGITVCIVFGLLFTTESISLVLYILLAIVILLVVGAILGHYVVTLQKNRLNDSLEKEVNKIANELKETGISIFEARRADKDEKIVELLKESSAQEVIPKIFKLGLALFSRFMAFGALISILGGLVSFALFVATYMQVKHLEFQNELIENQNEKIDIQNSLSESNRRAGTMFQLTSILEEVDEEIDIIENNIRRAGFRDIPNIKTALKDTSIRLFGEVDYSFIGTDYKINSFLDSLNLSRSVYPETNKMYLTPNLSARLIARITSISKVLRPYQYLIGKNKLSQMISPERWQLLLTLIESDLLGQNILSNSNFTYSEIDNVTIAKQDGSENNDITESNFIEFNVLDISNSFINNSRFFNCKFNNTYFDNAIFNDVAIENSELWNCSFKSAYIESLNLKNCDIEYIDLKDTKIDSLSFENTIICEADLSKSNVHQIYFSNSVLQNINITNLDSLHNSIIFLNCYTPNEELLQNLSREKFNISQVKRELMTEDEIEFIKNRFNFTYCDFENQSQMYKVSGKLILKQTEASM